LWILFRQPVKLFAKQSLFNLLKEIKSCKKAKAKHYPQKRGKVFKLSNIVFMSVIKNEMHNWAKNSAKSQFDFECSRLKIFFKIEEE